jgi:transposase
MMRLDVLQEVRRMRFEEIYGQYRSGPLSCEEAAEVLGMSVSTFYRYRRRYKEEGEEGLADRRLGKMSARRAGVDEVTRVLSLFQTLYYDFTVKHFHEKLEEHGVHRSYTWTKTVLQKAGLVKKAARRGAHRRKRVRRPLRGMLLHQDGSRHEWVQGRYWDLIVTLDDATGEIYSAFFVNEEGTMSTFQALVEVISHHGLFCSLYTDRGSHYWNTPKAGGKVDKTNPTQVGRALSQLGIEMIPAYSPEARGRSERVFGTLQGRLPQELRLRDIEEMEQANRFLREHFLPDYNRRFGVPSQEEGSAFVPFVGDSLKEVLCVQEERTVGNDNTVSYKKLTLQIPPDRHRFHYVRAKVRIHEYPEGGLAIFHGPRRLAEYTSMGELLTDKVREQAA